MNEKMDYYHQRNNNKLMYSFTVDSGNKGYHLVVFGAVHGNEVAGVEASIIFNNMLESGKIRLGSGKITFVLGNPEAFAVSTRFIDENMNRVFLDSIESHIEGERAKEIVRFLSDSGADYILDIHSVSVGDFQTLFYEEKEVHELLEVGRNISPISVHTVTNQDFTPGALVVYAHKMGIKGILVEAGNHNSSQTIENAFLQIIRMAAYLGLIEKEECVQNNIKIDFEKPKEVELYKLLETIKPYPGFRFVLEEVKTGTVVKKGQTYAVHDKGEYVALHNSVLFVPDPKPKVTDHDAGFLARCEKIA
jgi:succinylglutamate desuccinylase